jgi:hypothetical protein
VDSDEGAVAARHSVLAMNRPDNHACRSIEAFARMREALKEERAIKAELYEVLKNIDEWLHAGGDIKRADELHRRAIAALGKARGEVA